MPITSSLNVQLGVIKWRDVCHKENKEVVWCVLKCQCLLISLREEVRETHMTTELQALIHCQHEVSGARTYLSLHLNCGAALQLPGVSFVMMLKLLPVHVCLFGAGRSCKSFSCPSTPPSASSQNSHKYCFLKWYTKLFFFFIVPSCPLWPKQVHQCSSIVLPVSTR